MNLKTVFTTSTIWFLSVVFIYAKNNAAAKSVNTQKSSIEWVGKKMLGQHNGNVSLKSGTLHLKNNVLTGGSFVIDMQSIICTDIKDAAYNANLVKHLKGTDFFNVESHPTATLKITKVLKYVKKQHSYNVEADLTIKGITQKIKFPVELSTNGNAIEANANITIDRTLWDIKYKSSSFFEGLGDKAIKNEIGFVVKIVSN